MSNGGSSAGLAIAILVGIIVVVVLFRWLVGRGTDAIVNNTVGKKNKKAGAAMTSSDLTIRTNSEPAAVMGAIRQHVPAEAAAPALASTLYVAGNSENAILFAFGNKVGTSFKAQVSVTPADGGTTVLVEVTDWTKSGQTKAGATVQDGQRMQRLRDDVVAAVRTLDPAAAAAVVAR